jgi:hypothetical protein
MKRFLTFFILLLIAAVMVVVYLNVQRKNGISENMQLASTTPAVETEMTAERQTAPTTDQIYKNSDGIQVKWIILRDISRLKLYSNLEDKLTSDEAKDKYLCNDLTTASFYGTDGDHIGLFIAEGNQLSNTVKSTLFNGFFYVLNDKPYISRNAPSEAQIAIQAGPMLVENEKYLAVEGDEPARRIVLATNRQDNIIFIAIFDGNNPVSGPSLKELPGILENIDKNTSLDFLSAINLDGGTHSAFISDDIDLTEISIAGSYFCF